MISNVIEWYQVIPSHSESNQLKQTQTVVWIHIESHIVIPISQESIGVNFFEVWFRLKRTVVEFKKTTSWLFNTEWAQWEKVLCKIFQMANSEIPGWKNASYFSFKPDLFEPFVNFILQTQGCCCCCHLVFPPFLCPYWSLVFSTWPNFFSPIGANIGVKKSMTSFKHINFTAAKAGLLLSWNFLLYLMNLWLSGQGALTIFTKLST